MAPSNWFQHAVHRANITQLQAAVVQMATHIDSLTELVGTLATRASVEEVAAQANDVERLIADAVGEIAIDVSRL